MAPMGKNPTTWKQLPARFSYLANALTASISVLARRPAHGVWPHKPQIQTQIEIGPGGMGPDKKPYPGALSITFGNTWPFTIKANTNLVIGYVAASAYDKYLDAVEGHEGQQADLLARTWELPPHRWLQELNVRAKQDKAAGVDWFPKVEQAARYQRCAWDADRFFKDFPRMGAYVNLLLGLTVEAGQMEHDLIELFMLCCGGDEWIKDEVFNRLYEIIIDKGTKRAWDMSLISSPDEEDSFRKQVGEILDDLDVTISAFVGLNDPWTEGGDDAEIASILTLQLSKHITNLTGAVGTGLKVGGDQVDDSDDGEGGLGFDDEGLQELPELVEQLLADSDINEALASLKGQDPSAGKDSEQQSGIAAGDQEDRIQISDVRPPTTAEQTAADDLAGVLSAFSFEHRPGERHRQETGRVKPLDWYVAKTNSPGMLNYRTESVRDRRPEFSMAMALVCDTSGSMGMVTRGNKGQTPIQQLSAALFCLTQGFRQAVRYGSPSKLWTGCFNSTWELVTVKPDVVSEFRPSGGTQPEECISAAVAWLDEQPVAHRYLVVFTDDEWGAWDDEALSCRQPQTRLMFVPRGLHGDREHFDCHEIVTVTDMVQIISNTLQNSFTALAHSLR